MAPYDSDSSSDDGNYTTTNVTLGYASSDSTGDDISRIGGHPTWLDNKITPSATLAKCNVCNGYMSLLLLLNADLQQQFPNDQRRLHVWCCRKKTCSKKPGSIKTFREVRKGQAMREKKPIEKEKKTEPLVSNLGNVLFGNSPSTTPGNPFSSGNPFSTSGPATNGMKPLGDLSSLAAKSPQPPTESFADKLRISSPPPSSQLQPPSETWPSTSDFPKPYPQFYLDAYPEELEPTTSSDTNISNASNSSSKYDLEDASSAPEKDTFESTLDKTFQKFSDTIAQNPDQVLRYEFKGTPLLYSGADSVSSRFVVPHGKSGAVRGIPRCEKCGAQRVFEMQLVPGLIYEVEKDDEDVNMDEGMEWGTIIVGTCQNNCGEEGSVVFQEEWTGVQWEERMASK